MKFTDRSPEYQQLVSEEIENCENLGELMEVVETYFYMEEIKLKPLHITMLMVAVKTGNTKDLQDA